MKSFDQMTEDERKNLGSGQAVDYTTTLAGKVSNFEFNETLKVTTETTTNGERYIVELRNGEMVRTQLIW